MAKPSKPSVGVLKALVMPYFENTLKQRENAENCWNQVVIEMVLMFYPPFRAETEEELTDQSVAWLRACIDDLLEFPVHALAEGWKQVRRSHKTERWPTIQVIRDACMAIHRPSAAHGAVMPSTTEARAASFRSTGVWLDAWGPRPVSDQEKQMTHLRVMNSFYDGATPEMRKRYDASTERMRAGESAAAVLRDTLADLPGNEMPLLPSERMSSGHANRVRSESIARDRSADRDRYEAAE